MNPPEQQVLQAFRQYLMTPGKMLCFSGPDLVKHKAALRRLREQGLISEEAFTGGYSLTEAGFLAMKTLS